MILGLLGLLVFVGASLVVGLRILSLARRTRQFPETAIGLSLVLAGGVGTASTVIPIFFDALDPGSIELFNQFAIVVSHIGYALLYVFVWRVFRPAELWAAVLFGLCMTGLIVGGVGMMIELVPGRPLPGRGEPGTLWFWLTLASRFVAYGWAAVESLRYHAMMKRRLALGLANEEVVDRFFYWGVATVAVCGIWVNLASRAVFPDSIPVQATANFTTSMLGFVVAGSLFRAFFPMGSRVAASDAAVLEERG